MRSSDFPYLYDWFAISIRWLVLMTLTLSLALNDRLDAYTSAVLYIILVWNLYVSFLAILNRRMRAHRQINVIFDVSASLAMFWLSGGVQGPVSWCGFLALFSASIYFNSVGALIIAIIISLVEAGLSYLQSQVLLQLSVAVVVVLNLMGGLGLGFLSRKAVSEARSVFMRQIQELKNAEQLIVRQEHDRTQAYYALTATLSTTLNYQRVLDSAIDLGAKVIDETLQSSSLLVSAVLLFENDQLKIGSSRRMGPADQRVLLPAHSGVLAQAIQSADPQVTGSLANDPELGRIVALRSCKSAVCLTMRGGLDVFGILLFAHPEPNYFTPDRCEVLLVISQQAVIAIQNARLYENLEKEKELLIDSQEEARKKLARDLHDGPTQTVAAIAMRLNLARQLIQQDPAGTADELLRIEELALRTTKEIRHMLFTLRPLILESQGLVAALKAMAEKMKETYEKNVLIDVDPAAIEHLEIGKQTVIFFIVEEAVNNVRKHAQAAHTWVELNLLAHDQEIALLEVRDDGIGFDVKAMSSSYEIRGSLGMVNLSERSDLINGLLHIDSAPGQGTRVQVFIPLSEEATDRLHLAAN
jgi:signal transduction histidine kinase